jgi:hypothetical protein
MLLHSMWFEAAEHAFGDVLQSDPDCAIGHWGRALTLVGNLASGSPSRNSLAEGSAAIERAKALAAKAPWERDYIDAADVFYRDWATVDHWGRAAAYARAMEQVSIRHPEDQDARLFYAVALAATAASLDATDANRLKAAAIAEDVFAQDNRHPGAAAVLILAYDRPGLADRGLAAARRYTMIGAPTVAGRHLPSHIFAWLGLWTESIAANREAVAAARTAIEKLHPLESLVHAHVQLAQDAAARRLVDEARTVAVGQVDDAVAAYAMVAIPARYAVERAQWSEAATIALPASVSPQRFPDAAALASVVRGVGATRSGNLSTARAELQQLQAVRDADTEIHRQVLSAWILAAEGRVDDAIRAMRAAAEIERRTLGSHRSAGSILPPRLLLGEILLDARRGAEALVEFEAFLGTHPNRFAGLDGAMRAADLAGDRTKVVRYATELTKLAAGADSERPAIGRARTFVGAGAGRS